MYFEDLSLCYYHRGPCDADEWQAPLLAVGWLEPPHPFPTGELLADFAEKLESMIEAARNHYSQYHFRGLHDCDLCGVRETPPFRSYLTLWIPGKEVVYLAPGLITHYIGDHGYRPPAEFIAAVMACPEYGSPEYRAALQAANGGHPTPLLTAEESHALWEKQREEMARQHGKL